MKYKVDTCIHAFTLTRNKVLELRRIGIGIGNVSIRNKEQQVRIKNYAVGILTVSAFHTFRQVFYVDVD